MFTIIITIELEESTSAKPPTQYNTSWQWNIAMLLGIDIFKTDKTSHQQAVLIIGN